MSRPTTLPGAWARLAQAAGGVGELARLLGVSRRTIERWGAGVLPGAIVREHVIAFAKRRGVVSQPCFVTSTSYMMVLIGPRFSYGCRYVNTRRVSPGPVATNVFPLSVATTVGSPGVRDQPWLGLGAATVAAAGGVVYAIKRKKAKR